MSIINYTTYATSDVPLFIKITLIDYSNKIPDVVKISN